MRHIYSFLLIYVFSLNTFAAFAQWHDAYWLMGSDDFDNASDSLYGTSIMKFDSLGGKHKIYYDGNKTIDFWFSNASVSDALGNYLFSYNGYHIHDRYGQIMANGEGISSSGYPYGDIIPQGGIVLPIPQSTNKYILINESWDNIGLGATVQYLYYSIIDIQENMGAGKIIEKKKILITDTLDAGKIVATKHANGRDWWLLIPEYRSNRYYTLLITPNGINTFIQSVGIPTKSEFGQAAFSPNGKHYAKYTNISAIGVVNPIYFDIYHFDRCTGLLNNHAQLNLNDEAIPGGVAFSPDDKYLYITYNKKVFQLDMEAANIIASLKIVAQYDGYLSPQEGGWMVPTVFGDARLAPDGKIYIALTYAETREVHVIEYPNRLGAACSVRQHSVHFPTLVRAFPNFPNYRLGPLDGSPCDTLGLDNHPRANFRWEQEDTLNPLRVTFADLSFYAPDAWQWDFGDGTSSQEHSPVHMYNSPGIYQVCLRVSNQYDSDAYCQTLHLGVSATDNPVLQAQVQVSPNPFRERLSVSLSANLRSPAFRLYDMTGRLVRQERPAFGINEIGTADLPPGMYFWEVAAGGEALKSGKAVKIE